MNPIFILAGLGVGAYLLWPSSSAAASTSAVDAALNLIAAQNQAQQNQSGATAPTTSPYQTSDGQPLYYSANAPANTVLVQTAAGAQYTVTNINAFASPPTYTLTPYG